MQKALAQRYAQSLIKVAQAESKLEVVEQDLVLIAELLKANPSFGEFLSSPVQNRQQKTDLIKNVFQGKIQELTLNLLGLLVRNWRAGLLPLVVNEFQLNMELSKGMVRGTIVSAKALDESQIKQIDELMSKQYASKFIWTCKEDSSLVAGFRIRVGDKVIDHSLSLKLKELEKQLLAKA